MSKLKLLDNVLHNHRELPCGSVIDPDEHGMDAQVATSLVENAAAMWLLRVRVKPDSGISKRHRCAMLFDVEWQVVEVDSATRQAIEQDSYLEFSDNEPNNPVKNPTDDGLIGDAAQGSGAIDASLVESEAEAGIGADQTAAGNTNETGGDAPAADAAEAVADGTAAMDGEQPADAVSDNATDLRIAAIKAAIAALDANNPEHWLKDGRPSTSALESVGGLIVTAAERDSIWASVDKGAE